MNIAKQILTTCFIATCGLSAMAQKNLKPNIIVIFCDDMGYGDLGCNGSKLNRTPNLDRMANQGVRFTDCYSAANVCSPSRIALITGRYPIRTGIVNVLFPWQSIGIDASEVTIPEMLQKAGYYTGMVGKWHLGHQRDHLPLQHGFKEYFGIPYSNDMKPCIYLRGNDIESENVDQDQLTKTYTGEAVRFIEKNHNRPFFLYLAHNMPHTPIHASEQFRGKSANGLYGDVIEEIDWSVGEVLKKLRALKIEENTLIVFSSDNGPWLIKGPDAGSPLPFSQGKFTTWEGGHREPTIAYWKGKIKPKVFTGMITLMDWFPTFARLAQTKLPDDRITDGSDITDVLFGDGKRKNEEFFFFEGAKICAYRSGDFKLKLPHGPFKGNQFMKEVPAHDTLLFNVRSDVAESKNLIQSNPQKMKEMTAKLKIFQNSIKDLKPQVGEGKPSKNR